MSLPLVPLILKQYTLDKCKILHLPLCLLDTGSECNILNLNVLTPDFERSEKQNKILLTNAFNSKMGEIREEITVNVCFPDSSIEVPNVTFDIISEPCEYHCILGFTFLRNHDINFKTRIPRVLNSFTNLEKYEFKFLNVVRTISSSDDGTELRAADDIILEPMSHSWVKLKPREHSRKVLFIESGDLKRVNITFTSHFDIDSSKNQVKLFNGTNKFVQIHKDALLGQVLLESELGTALKKLNFLVASKDLGKIERQTLNTEVAQWKKLRDQLCKEINIEPLIKSVSSKVPVEYSDSLKTVLSRFSWFYARTNEDAGMSNHYVAELIIKGDNSPHFSVPYKTNPDLVREVDIKLKEMQKHLIIEKTCSAWNHPILFIRKASGALRPVNNYSSGKNDSLNSRLLIPRFPCYPIRTILGNISAGISKLRRNFPDSPIVFLSIDIKNAFFSLSIREGHRDLTSFIYSDKQFRYVRMSQGLSSSPGVFNYFINLVLSDLPGQDEKYCLFNYFDDFFIVTTEKHHNFAAETLLQRLTEHNLIISLEKCAFYERSTKFLGYILSPSGVSPDPKKVQALLELDYPKTLKEAQQCLGLLNFYTRNIKNLSVNLSALSKEIGKGKEFKLNDTIRKGIGAIKSEISKGTTTKHLEYPDINTNERLFVACDTSLTRTGAIIGNLTLKNDVISNIRIAAYASKLLTEQETLLSARGRELIGISLGLKAFKDLIPKSIKFLVFCDHKSLENVHHSTNLKTSGSTRVRLAYSELCEFPNLEVRYISASHEIIEIADALSRLSFLDTECLDRTIFHPKNYKNATELNATKVQFPKPIVDVSAIIADQKSDPNVSAIRKQISGKFCTFKGIHYRIENDILYRATKAGKWLAIVPLNSSRDLISYYHIAIGHGGRDLLLQRLKDEPLWLTNKTELITEITRGCLLCHMQLPERFSHRSEEKQQIRPTLRPYAHVFVDCVDFSFGEKTIPFLTFVDGFSLRLSAKRLKSKESVNIVPQMMLLLTEFSCSGRTCISSDNGKEFLSKAMAKTLSLMNLDHSQISPYNSRANRAERCHRDIRALLRTIDFDKKDCEWTVQMAVAVYNNRPKSSLNNHSPNEIALMIPQPMIFDKLELTKELENPEGCML